MYIRIEYAWIYIHMGITYAGKGSQDLRAHTRSLIHTQTQVKNLRALFSLDPEDIDEVLPKS